jgi:hypothetical protein
MFIAAPSYFNDKPLSVVSVDGGGNSLVITAARDVNEISLPAGWLRSRLSPSAQALAP